MTWTLTSQIAVLMAILFLFLEHMIARKHYMRLEARDAEREANLEYHNLINLKDTNAEFEKMKKDFEEMSKRVDALTLRAGFKL